MFATISLEGITALVCAIAFGILQAWNNWQNRGLKKNDEEIKQSQDDHQKMVKEVLGAIADHLDTVQKKRELPGFPVAVPPASTEEIRKP